MAWPSSSSAPRTAARPRSESAPLHSPPSPAGEDPAPRLSPPRRLLLAAPAHLQLQSAPAWLPPVGASSRRPRRCAVRLPFLYLTLASSRLPLRVRAERRAPEGQKRAEVAIADLQACAAPFSIPPNLLCQTSIPCIYSFTPRSSTISGHRLPKPRVVPAARRRAAVAMVAVDDLVGELR